MLHPATDPETFQSVIDDVRRTVAVAAWKGALIHVDEEARRLAVRHQGTLVPLVEIKEHVLRLAAEHGVPTEIG